MSYGFPYQQQAQAYQPITATFPSATADPHYKGYEQAVIEHAKMLQVQQAKEQLFGVPQRKPFVGQWPKKKGPPKEPVDPRKYFCELCNVTCAGPESFQSHMVGKSHKHKEALKTGKVRLDLTRPGFHCEVCNATCSAKDAFHAHLNGVKHTRAIKTLQMLGKPIPEYLLAYQPKGDPMQNFPVVKKVVGVSATKFVGGVKLSSMHGEEDDGANANESESGGFQPIGEEFIEVIPSQIPVNSRRPTRPSFRCKICECAIGDPASRDLHVRGRRHRVSYKQKIDPTIQVDEKLLKSGPAGFGTIQAPKPPVQLPKTNRPIGSKLNRTAQSFQASFYKAPVLPDTSSSDAYDEQFVYARLEQIHPTVEQMTKIEELVETVERGLKKVSDVLIETSGDQEARLLRGVVRVGPLGENILLNFDKAVNVVLLCKDVPSVSLLKQIVDELPNHVENVKCDSEGVREKYAFEMLPDESAFRVQMKNEELSCTVTLSSVVLRTVNENEGQNGEGSEDQPSAPPKEIVRPVDALPGGPCLCALAALRHTKFFQAQCEAHPSLNEIVKLLRDVVKRIDTWSVLSLYVVELLAYKALSSHALPLRVADGARRFFEMISCGTFMLSNSKLLDPCEKDEVNVLHGMTNQQRENLVCSAQHGLRLITYDQIYTILGLSRDTLTRKRTSEAIKEDSEGAETKKAKSSGQKPQLAVDPDATNKPVMPLPAAFKQQ